MTFFAPRENGACRTLVAAILLGTASTTFCIAPAIAQTANTATLSGTVKSSSGKPLGNARITITAAGYSTTVESRADGTFSVALPPNTYSIEIFDRGFENFRNDGITVTTTQGTNLTFALQASTLQTIGRTTGNRTTSVNPTSSDTAVVSNQTFVDQGQNQVVNVLDQIPGVEINRDSSNAPGANTSISIRGAQPYESQILIDGHPALTSANGPNGFNSTFINSLLLGNVEVDQGPGNMPSFVENAVGGTVNFRTPNITGGPTANAVVGFDSFNGNYYGVTASDTIGKFGFLVGIANNQTPGYLSPSSGPQGNLFSGNVAPSIGPGQANQLHYGVVDFSYNGSQAFSSNSQLAKIAYNFSPQTSITLSQYTTQTNNDETGTNDQSTLITVVPCINSSAATNATAQTCTPGGTTNEFTSNGYTHLVGQQVPINLYAPYPNTTEFDNEPIYSAEFRTVVGPGSFLARYYAGAVDRIITQDYAPGAYNPCATPACPATSGNTYDSAPYVEDTIDKLQGGDAEYSIPFGANSVTLGFDRHSDSSTYGTFAPPASPTFPQNIIVSSNTYTLRGTFAITPKLTLESGNYFSSTSYVGNRFDPRDGLIYRLNPNVAIRAAAGSAYVAPYYGIIQPTNQVVPGTLTLASLAFKPETSFGYDIGTDVKLNRDSLLSFDGYLNNVFNRYASVTTELPAQQLYQGTAYNMVTQVGNQALVREEGLEANFIYAPRVGLGFHTAIDLLRDYAYDQSASSMITSQNIFSATPANNVQLPGYPFSKLRNDLFYTFKSGLQARFSATSYGQNNAFGEPAFTEFDGSIRVPVRNAFVVNLGGTNIFNHDNYQAGGIYNGGPTFPTLGAGTSYSTLYYTQPRTLFIQLQRSVGPGGTNDLPRASL